MKKLYAAGVALGMSSLLVGCSVSPSQNNNGDAAAKIDLIDSTKPASGPVDEIKWALFSEPTTLDPDTGQGSSSRAIMANVCEGLFQLQPDLTLKPLLAESFEQVNPTTVVYKIRPGVTFHNGSPVTASDVVWSLQRHSEGVGAGEFENVSAIEQTGDMEVTLRLKEADALQNVRLAALDTGSVLDKEVVEQFGESFGTAGSKDACSGPYRLGTWNAGSSVVLERYDGYWDKEKAGLAAKVSFTWGSSASVTNAIKTGAADGVYVADSPGLVTALQNQSGVKVYFGPATGAEKLIPTGSGTDPKIRKALSLAIDRNGIAKAAFQGIAVPWKVPEGPGAWGYAKNLFQEAYDKVEGVPASPTEKDLEEARKLVQEAGVPDRPIVIASSGSELRNVIANALVSAGQSIGVKVEIVTLGETGYDELYSSEEARKGIDFISDDWDLSKPEPLALYDNYLPGSSVNYLDYKNERYTTALQTAMATYDDTDRANLVLELQKIAQDDMLWIPLVSTPNPLILNERLTGAPVSGTYFEYPWAARIGAASK